jgi:hypothetical protein
MELDEGIFLAHFDDFIESTHPGYANFDMLLARLWSENIMLEV